MARIAPEEVRRLARLARLGLTAAEVERLASQMGGILEHFEALRDAVRGSGGAARAEEAPRSTGESEPASESESERALGGRARAPLRPDADGTDPLLEPPETTAPRWQDGYFLVPRPPGVDGER